MKILFASAHPYPPQIAGGVQSNTHELATELIKVGHQVAVLSGLIGSDYIGIKSRLALKIWNSKFVMDKHCGYQVYRAWFPWCAVQEVLSHFKPDIVFVQSGQPVKIAMAFEQARARTAIYLHNVEFGDHGGDFGAIIHLPMIANSSFTAETYRSEFGVNAAILHPFFVRSRYEVVPSGQYVTFINPHPLKGSTLALEIAAACPDIEFRFVKSWTLDKVDSKALARETKGLRNVKVLTSTSDMRPIYANTKVLLVPSRWSETWGRVVSEAHFSGIPVVASDRGGLPEAVGPGGILINPNAGLSTWIDAVRLLCSEPRVYDATSRAARMYSNRPALDSVRQLEQFVAFAERVLDTKEG